MSESPSLEHADRAVELLRSLEALKTDDPRQAEPLERCIARLIDLGLFLVLFVVLGLAAGGIIVFFDPPESPGEAADGPLATAVSLFGTICLLLALLANELRSGVTGQTLGKKMYSVTVVDRATGKPPGLWRAAVRTGVWLVPLCVFAVLSAATVPKSISLLFFAGAWLPLVVPLWMFLDRDHRGLHDILTRTSVRRQR